MGQVNAGLAAYQAKRREEKMKAQDFVFVPDFNQGKVVAPTPVVRTKQQLPAKTAPWPDLPPPKHPAPMDRKAYNKLMGYE